MLLDAVLAIAPVLIVLAAAEKLPRTPYTYATRKGLEKRLDSAMRLTAKVPTTVAGYHHIAGDIDRQALRLAYAIRYPQRAGEVVDVALVGVLTAVSALVYVVVLIVDGPGLYLLALLALQVIAMLWFRRAAGNFTTNDELNYELFVRFGAPERLQRRGTDLVGRMTVRSADDVLALAADVRDARAEEFSTLAAVNQVLAQSHAHGAWKGEWEKRARIALSRVTDADYRGYATTARAHTARHGGTAYDWALRHVVGPVFSERLKLIDDREHLRVAHAEKAGDVFKAAWLRAHYRAERTRVLQQWQAIHQRIRPARHETGDA